MNTTGSGNTGLHSGKSGHTNSDKNTRQPFRLFWFSFLYVASLAGVVAIGGSMRLLLVYM